MTESFLLRQYQLLGAVIDAPWATHLDHKITRHVIDRYYAKFGNARASLRYLEQATGSARNNIIVSLRRIIDHGVISVIRLGIGTRPTEYALNFDFAARGNAGVTSTRGDADVTASGYADVTSSSSRGYADVTESYLLSMSTDMLTEVVDDPAVAAPPPVAGLEAHTAAPAGLGGFEELWQAFPRKHQRAKARAAYEALAPTPELHARLVELATAWGDHYRSTGIERKWWKHLHTWLAAECFLEDLPVPYENPKAAKPKTRAASKSAPPKAGNSGLSPKTPQGRHDLIITHCQMFKSEREETLLFDYEIKGGAHDGKEFSHTFANISDDEELMYQGSLILRGITKACDLFQANDPADFKDRTLSATVGAMGRIEYHSAY